MYKPINLLYLIALNTLFNTLYQFAYVTSFRFRSLIPRFCFNTKSFSLQSFP